MFYEAGTNDSVWPWQTEPVDPTRPVAGARLQFAATAYCKGVTTASGVEVRTGARIPQFDRSIKSLLRLLNCEDGRIDPSNNLVVLTETMELAQIPLTQPPQPHPAAAQDQISRKDGHDCSTLSRVRGVDLPPSSAWLMAVKRC